MPCCFGRMRVIDLKHSVFDTMCIMLSYPKQHVSRLKPMFSSIARQLSGLQNENALFQSA